MRVFALRNALWGRRQGQAGTLLVGHLVEPSKAPVPGLGCGQAGQMGELRPWGSHRAEALGSRHPDCSLHPSEEGLSLEFPAGSYEDKPPPEAFFSPALGSGTPPPAPADYLGTPEFTTTWPDYRASGVSWGDLSWDRRPGRSSSGGDSMRRSGKDMGGDQRGWAPTG